MTKPLNELLEEYEAERLSPEKPLVGKVEDMAVLLDAYEEEVQVQRMVEEQRSLRRVLKGKATTTEEQ